MMAQVSWIDRTKYPFESHWYDVGKKRMHYVDEGEGAPIVFVHGAATWSFAFRRLIQSLRGQFRCIAPDLIGFGLSDKPVNWTYRPERDADYLCEFIESRHLSNVTLVVQGMGGPIGLEYALRHPENVGHVVVMNSWMWPLTENLAVQRLDKQVNGVFGRFSYLKLNKPVRDIKRSIQDRSNFSGDDYAHYWNALDEPIERVGAYGYAKSLLASTHFFQSQWDRKEAIKHIRALVLWGMSDRMLPLSSLQRWEMIFSDLEIMKLGDTGPFVMEEKGLGLGPHIEMFLNDTAYLPTATLM